MAGQAGASTARSCPSVTESSEVTGRISHARGRDTGLAEGTPVVAGAGDQAASAVGNGIVAPGCRVVHAGNFGRGLRAHANAGLRSSRPRPHVLSRGARRMARDGRDAGRGTEPAVVPQSTWRPELPTTISPRRPRLLQPARDGLFWLPYLMGERTPHLDASARGGWIGLTAKHTRADLIRALLEGVSYSQKDCLDIVEQMGGRGRIGTRFGRRRAQRFLAADAGGRFRQARGGGGNPGRVGLRAALLALVGTGAYTSVQEVCQRRDP